MAVVSQGAFPNGIKDVDIQILLNLLDYELNNACQTNVYVRQLCNEDRLWILKIDQRFPQAKVYKPENMSWREFYNNADDGYNIVEERFYTLKEAFRHKRIKSYDILLKVNDEKLDHSYLKYVEDIDTFKWLTSNGVIPSFETILKFFLRTEGLIESAAYWMIDNLKLLPTKYDTETLGWHHPEIYLYLVEKFNYPIQEHYIADFFKTDNVNAVKTLIRPNIPIDQKHIDSAAQNCALNVLKYVYEQTGKLPEYYPSGLHEKCIGTRHWIFEARIDKGLYEMPHMGEGGPISLDILGAFRREFQRILDYKGINSDVMSSFLPVQVASNVPGFVYNIPASSFIGSPVGSPVRSPTVSPVALHVVQLQPTFTPTVASPIATQYQPTFTPSAAPIQFQPTFTPAAASPAPTQFQPTFTPAASQFQPTFNPASAQFQPTFTSPSASPAPTQFQPSVQQTMQPPSGTVTNPETGRTIQVGKATYNNLLKKGYVYVNGQLVKR